MKPQAVEAWAWLLIYGGLVGFSLGLFVQPLDSWLGHGLVVSGLLVAGLGVLLIVVRSRMHTDDDPRD